MADAFVEIPDFQFRELQHVRIFDKPVLYNGIRPSWIAASSRYGIIVCAAGHDKLISLRSSDVHQLNTVKVDTEVTNIQMKVTCLQIEQPAVLIALTCNCSGRLLSVSMRTASGAFVYLYDMCSFAVDFVEQRGPVYSLRLSADPNAQPCALEWNPLQDDLFAVATSDGVLSCYSFNIEKSSSVTLVGTTKHSDIVTCIGWSPKGKQLVVGDVSGYVKQYKPEMVSVRVVPPPTCVPSLKGDGSLRCVGISWLATTDILIAYSPKTGREVDIAKLCVKKDAPPQWTHFDDINYCGDRSSFDQRIEFTQFIGWKLLLCSSSRSSEIAVLGKIGSEWKIWTLDDNGRIEMPLDSEHCETYPVGIAVDISSVLPAKIGDEGNIERPPCPTVLVLSSQGILLPFSVLSSRAEHQIINIQPEALPSKIYGPVLTVVNIAENMQSNVGSPHITSQTVPVTTNLLSSLVFSESTPITKQDIFQSQVLESTPSTVTASSKVQNLTPTSVVQNSAVSHQQLKKRTDLITNLQKDFREKLVVFDKHFFELCEQNDWLYNLKKSSAKQLEWNIGINLNDEMLELEKVRAVVASWLDALENQVKESMCSVEEQLGIANSTDRELFDNGRVLDFNNVMDWTLIQTHRISRAVMHRLDKLVETLAKLEQKVANVEDVLSEMPASHIKSGKILTLGVDQEQQIATTAKNICKGMVSRRKALCELQQRVTSLSCQLKPLKKEQEINKYLSSTKSSFSNLSFSHQTYKEIIGGTAAVTAQQQKELLRFLAERGPVKRSEAKILALDIHSGEGGERILNSTITDIESRLLEAALIPMKTPTKLVMDIGTQSSDYLYSKEATSPTDKTIPNRIASADYTPSVAYEPPEIQAKIKCINFNWRYKYNIEDLGFIFNPIRCLHLQLEPTTNLPATLPSFKNLNTSTALPSTSNCPATCEIAKSLPAGNAPTNIAKTVNSNQEQSGNITFSFKNLDIPSAARNNVSTRETGFSTLSTPNKSEHSSEASQQIFSMKKDENGTATASLKSAAASESLTNISSAVVSSSATTIETSGTSTQSSEISRTNSEVAVSNPTSNSNTASGTLTNVSFTFKLPTAESQQAPLRGTLSGNTNSTIQPLSKDLESVGDDGMMEAEGTSTAPTALFSSSLSFGSKSTVSSMNQVQNVFGSGLKFLPSAQPQTTSLFSNVAGNKSNSVFGGGTTTTSSSSGGLFSQAQQSNAASFSFSSAAKPQNSSSLFGAKTATGGATFGGAPSFGSKPVFGSPSPLVSAFGQQRSQHSAPTSTAFSNFAKTSSVGFGSLAASQQQQSTGSVFGGSGFGALAQQPQKSSIFGGGLNSSATNRY
uniref:Anaphase-promoting complex subunit 4-like WD40 domain-containing protein n=1 Tax=Setaria digitata TaxID=48799 RepID=A0A915PHC5_9BILA